MDTKTYTGRAYRVLDPETLALDWTPLENGLKYVRARCVAMRGDMPIIKSNRSGALYAVPGPAWDMTR